MQSLCGDFAAVYFKINLGKYSSRGPKQLGFFLDPDVCVAFTGGKDELIKNNL
jgi:hypothetical protein